MADRPPYTPPGAEDFRRPLGKASDQEIEDALAHLGPETKKVERPKTAKELNPLEPFSDKEKLAIIAQARKEVDEELREREAGDEANAKLLSKMRASVEKGTSAADKAKQLAQVRRIMLDNKIAELAARRTKGSASEINISDDDLDAAFGKLGTDDSKAA